MYLDSRECERRRGGRGRGEGDRERERERERERNLDLEAFIACEIFLCKLCFLKLSFVLNDCVSVYASFI